MGVVPATECGCLESALFMNGKDKGEITLRSGMRLLSGVVGDTTVFSEC